MQMTWCGVAREEWGVRWKRIIGAEEEEEGKREGEEEEEAHPPDGKHCLDSEFSSPRSKNLPFTMMSHGAQKENVRCLDSFGVLE